MVDTRHAVGCRALRGGVPCTCRLAGAVIEQPAGALPVKQILFYKDCVFVLDGGGRLWWKHASDAMWNPPDTPWTLVQLPEGPTC